MPLSDDLLPLVRSSCHACIDGNVNPHVTLGPPSAFASAASTLSGLPPPTSNGIDLPLRLSEDEGIDATVLLCLLQMGSGFRKPLHAACGHGASDCMIRGTLAFLLTGKSPKAGVLAHLRAFEIAETWGIPMTIDEPVPNLPVATISKPGPLAPLAEAMARMLNGVGRELLAAGFPTFASAFRGLCARWQEEGGASTASDASGGAAAASACRRPNVGRFVGFLVDTFPSGFKDWHESAGGAVGGGAGGGVWVLKKAQLCAKELGRKYGATHPTLFGWQTHTSQLTAFADNVLPAMLRVLGVLVPSDPLGAKVDGGVEVSGEEAGALRAATIVACEKLAEVMGVTEEALDQILWVGGKLDEYRKVERHVFTKTCFY